MTRNLAGFEDFLQVPVHPVHVISKYCQTLGTGELVPDHLSVGAVVADAVDGVLPGVHPEDVVSLHVNGEVGGVTDAAGHEWSPVTTVKICSDNLRKLSVVQPVNIFLDWINFNLTRTVGGGGVDHLPVGSIKPADLVMMGS